MAYYNTGKIYNDNIFYGPFPKDVGSAVTASAGYHYCPETQALADLLPPTWRLRQDLFSTGQQFLNPAGQTLRSLNDQIKGLQDNSSLSTFRVDGLDTLYRLALGLDFAFVQETNDPRQISWRPPFLRGFIDSNIYEINTLEANTLEALDRVLPTRIELTDIVAHGLPVLEATPLNQLSQASFEPLAIPGYLYLTLSGLEQKGQIYRSIFYPAQIRITGETTKGTIEEETVVFPANLTLPTRKRYKSVLKVKTLYMVPETATLTITDASGGPAAFITDTDLVFSVDRQDQYANWSINGNSLQCSYYLPGTEAMPYLESRYTFQLTDPAGVPLSGNCAVYPILHHDFLAVTNGSWLFLYHKLLEYPDQATLAHLKNLTDPCLLAITADRYFYQPGNILQILPWQLAPTQGIIQYSFQVAPPGSPLSPYQPDAANNLTLAGATTWINNPARKNLQVPALNYNLTLDQPGYWAVALTALYDDGTTSTDVRLFGALQKTPLAAFDLSVSFAEELTGVFVDSQEKLWVKDSSRCGQFNLLYDYALVDYQRKLIYFKEAYDEVEVIP